MDRAKGRCNSFLRLGEYPQVAAPLEGARETGVPPPRMAGDAIEAAWSNPRGETAALQSLGFGKPLIAELSTRARRNGTTLENELLHQPGIDENAYYAAMARFLRLPFVAAIDSKDIVDSDQLDTQLLGLTMVRVLHCCQAPRTAVVPEAGRIGDLAAALGALPTLRNDLVLTTPGAICAST